MKVKIGDEVRKYTLQRVDGTKKGVVKIIRENSPYNNKKWHVVTVMTYAGNISSEWGNTLKDAIVKMERIVRLLDEYNNK